MASLAPPPVQPPVAAGIQTFAADCTTPKTTFALGDEICIQVSGFDTSLNRRIAWVDPGGFIRENNGNLFTGLTTDPQSDSFTLPATDTSIISGVYTVDNRGPWSVTVVSSRGSVVARAPFTVEGATPVADLSIITGLTNGSANAGETITYVVNVTNRGPSDAVNVVVTDPTPLNTTFQTVTQTSGPAFDCSESDSSSVKCTIATLANGDSAIFEIKYTVGSAGSSISNSASVTSDTTELNPADNGSDASQVRVGNEGGATTACTLTCPADFSVTANMIQGGQAGAIVTFSSGEAFGSCGTVSSSPASGSFFPVGPNTVQTTSSQGGGACSFTITVLDSAPPTIDCPADKTVTAADGDCSASVDPGTPTTTGTDVTVAGVRSDGAALDDPYPSGTTNITWTATDSNGRTAHCTQKITVIANDTTPPTITAPPDLTLYTGAGVDICGVVIAEEARLTADASDNCSVSVTRTGIPAGNFFPTGTTTVTYTAKDGAGNTATATQQVTVIDNTVPVIVAPPDASYVCPSEVPAADPSQAHGDNINLPNGGPVFDNCGTPLVTITETSTGAGSASSPRVITRTFTATDSSNNSASSVQTITVIDSTAPTISCPTNLVVYLPLNTTDTSMPVSYAAPTASDNCGTPTVVTSPASGSTFPVGTTTVTATATDAAGNSSSCSFTVTVLYNFTGFFQPVGNLPILNVVNAGRAIPVKFSLSGNKGLAIMAANSPSSGQITCNSSDPAVDLTDTVTAGGSSLSYSASSDQYNYVWATQSSWAGTCRQLVVQFNDGSVHRANFKFK